ncbi:MAG: hypothetical protein J7M16_12610 [Anaerolineae bacterium]|nr:hypothetical protein [Anaerolineae bacterium]RLC64277.1 MAG: hypothetical protein DRI80_01825 [Chloroflexota bacterium]
MKRKFSILSSIYVVIAGAVGVIVLLGFFVEIEGLHLQDIQTILLDWAVTVAAFAFLLGAVNVVRVNLMRIRQRKGGLYSMVTLAAMLFVLAFGLTDGPHSLVVQWTFEWVLVPLQATLFSLMAFFVVIAAWRVFRLRSLESALLLLVGVLILVSQVPLKFPWAEDLTGFKNWILAVPAMAGARGIILGVTLGIVTTGLRLLLGIDRPYSD